MGVKTTLQIMFAVLIINNANSQTFEWTFQTVSEGNNIQMVKKTEDGTAIIAGFGNTLVKSIDGGTTWTDLGVLTNADYFDYQDISIKNSVGYAVAMSSFKVVDRVENDIVADCSVLKTTDWGQTWSLVPLNMMGTGNFDSLNISLPGNNNRKFTAVECINDDVAYVAASWNNVAGNKHSNVFKTIDGGVTWMQILTDKEGDVINSIEQFNGHIYIAGNKMLYKVSILSNTVFDLYPIVDNGSDDAMYFWNISTYNNSELIFPTTTDSIRITANEGASFYTVPGISGANVVYKHDDTTYVVGGTTTKTKGTFNNGTTWIDCSVGESIWNGGVYGDSLIALAKNDIYKMALVDIEAGNFAWAKTDISLSENMIKGMDISGGDLFLVGFSDFFASSENGGITFQSVILPPKSDMVNAGVDIDFRGLGVGADSASIITSRKYKLQDNATADDVFLPGVIFTTTNNWETYTVVDDTKIGAKYGSKTDVNPYAEHCSGQDYFAAECINDTVFYVYVQWSDTSAAVEEIHGRVFKTTDNGMSWDTITSNLKNLYVTTVTFIGDNGFIAGNNVLLKTINGGESVTDLLPLLANIADNNIYINDVNMVSSDTVFVSTTSDGVFVTYNGGATFQLIPGTTGANGTYVFDKNSWLTMGTSARTYYTNNYGVDWDYCYPGTTIYGNGIVIGDTLIAPAKSGVWKLYVPSLDIGVYTNDLAANKQSNIIVYQNETVVSVVSTSEIYKCELISITGVLVNSTGVNALEHNIETAYNIPGVYIVRVFTAKGIESQKIVIR